MNSTVFLTGVSRVSVNFPAACALKTELQCTSPPMPRRSRFHLIDVPQHIIQRGNNRQATFFAEEDYCFYIERLGEGARKYACSIYAHVLMTNHVHLLASAQRPYALSLMMQYVGRYFVRHINRAHRRSGTLWEGRFKSSLVDTEPIFCAAAVTSSAIRSGLRWWRHRENIAGRVTTAMLSACRTSCSPCTNSIHGSAARTKCARAHIANCSAPNSIPRN